MDRDQNCERSCQGLGKDGGIERIFDKQLEDMSYEKTGYSRLLLYSCQLKSYSRLRLSYHLSVLSTPALPGFNNVI